MPRSGVSESLRLRTTDVFGSKLQLGSLGHSLVAAIGNKRSYHWHFFLFIISTRCHNMKAPRRQRQVSFEQHGSTVKEDYAGCCLSMKSISVANTSYREVKITYGTVSRICVALLDSAMLLHRTENHHGRLPVCLKMRRMSHPATQFSLIRNGASGTLPASTG
jgi:hypothetical protein